MIQTMDEYRVVFARNLRSSGRGADEKLHVPCPFCAAPEWFVASAEEFQRDSSPIYCISCGRSAELRNVEGNIQVHFLAGPEVPKWLDGIYPAESPSRVFSAGQLSDAVIKPHPRRLPPGIRGLPHRELRALGPTEPPGFRSTRAKIKNCHHCVHVDKAKGVCTLYNGWPVKRNDVCDKFQKEK